MCMACAHADILGRRDENVRAPGEAINLACRESVAGRSTTAIRSTASTFRASLFQIAARQAPWPRHPQFRPLPMRTPVPVWDLLRRLEHAELLVSVGRAVRQLPDRSSARGPAGVLPGHALDPPPLRPLPSPALQPTPGLLPVRSLFCRRALGASACRQLTGIACRACARARGRAAAALLADAMNRLAEVG